MPGAKIGTLLLQMVSCKRFGVNENILSASNEKFPFEDDKIFQMSLDLLCLLIKDDIIRCHILSLVIEVHLKELLHLIESG